MSELLMSEAMKRRTLSRTVAMDDRRLWPLRREQHWSSGCECRGWVARATCDECCTALWKRNGGVVE